MSLEETVSFWSFCVSNSNEEPFQGTGSTLYGHVVSQKNETSSVVLLCKLNKLHTHTWTRIVLWVFFFFPQLKFNLEMASKLKYNCVLHQSYCVTGFEIQYKPWERQITQMFYILLYQPILEMLKKIKIENKKPPYLLDNLPIRGWSDLTDKRNQTRPFLQLSKLAIHSSEQPEKKKYKVVKIPYLTKANNTFSE